jgi:hypothetical protein
MAFKTKLRLIHPTSQAPKHCHHFSLRETESLQHFRFVVRNIDPEHDIRVTMTVIAGTVP